MPPNLTQGGKLPPPASSDAAADAEAGEGGGEGEADAQRDGESRDVDEGKGLAAQLGEVVGVLGVGQVPWLSFAYSLAWLSLWPGLA